MVIERALEDRQRLQQWQQQQELKEGDVAAGHGSHSGGVGPAAGLRPAAQTPSQGTDAGHARDQQPTCGGGPPAPTSSKGWWSAWLPSAPLQWSTPTPQPQPLHALPPGSATSPPGSAAAAAAAAAATYHNAASTAERRAVFDDAAHSVPIAAPRTAPASTCRRRHVHRPALGQE
ncbi:hypothetical protein HYH02_005483 [Chlamydomonas schloesseri]|uniref:Uncharacterized protein n=1 Tax=Chlamydomonas schloesseri TaxID=2026947 RepID=A0A835WL87_9CHLO|nr:hypothetical protein HYH02_005483 [Chlamydomonas schloesseri]|eukprot:KAG2449328.1 hypothetical protein HYH02_005483 [Chlamydomonas schloesseri]